MIKPEPGRVVHVRFRTDRPDEQPLAATVAYVHNDRMVNVGFLDRSGKHGNLTSVRLLQDDDKPQGENCWAEWMPYQRRMEQAGQAEGRTPAPKQG